MSKYHEFSFYILLSFQVPDYFEDTNRYCWNDTYFEQRPKPGYWVIITGKQKFISDWLVATGYNVYLSWWELGRNPASRSDSSLRISDPSSLQSIVVSWSLGIMPSSSCADIGASWIGCGCIIVWVVASRVPTDRAPIAAPVARKLRRERKNMVNNGRKNILVYGKKQGGGAVERFEVSLLKWINVSGVLVWLYRGVSKVILSSDLTSSSGLWELTLNFELTIPKSSLGPMRMTSWRLLDDHVLCGWVVLART